MENNAMPVFVKVDDYKDTLDVVDLIQDKLNEAHKIIGRINELRNEEDKEVNLWNSQIQDITNKISQIDKILFEPEKV